MGNLTNSQKSIWVTEQYYKGSSINNICGSATIEEQIDFEKLREAIEIVCLKHDNFRLQLEIKDGKPQQKLTEKKEVEINFLNISNQEQLKEETNKIVRKSFELENSKLYKFYIYKFQNGEGGFMLNIHHLIADAWTLAFICNEIIKTYSNLKQNKEIERKAIYSYIDYIKAEQEYLESEKYQKDKEYWNAKFEKIPEVATIPGSKKEPNENEAAGERKQFNLAKSEVEKIKQYCKENKISLYNFFMAIYAIYIGEISNLDEFVIGTPILNRTNFKEKNAAGMFINMAPFKINISEEEEFKEFTKQIAIDSMGMLKHQKYSYQCLLEDLRKKNNKIPNLYNILLSYQITNAHQSGGDMTYKTEWTFNGCCAENMDIQIYDLNDTGSLNISYDYKTSIYDVKDIDNLHKRILNLIEQIVNKENIKIKELEIVTPEEKEKLLVEFNKTEMEYDKTGTVIKLFEKQVEQTPEKTAIISNGQHLTYKELNEKANMLAREMMAKGVKQQDIVGIMLNRSPEMIIGLIAILKCGATYLPIDPEYPAERISYMLDNSETKIILVNSSTERYSPNNCEAIDVEKISAQSNENLNLNISEKSLAYLIYTSGSTGKPKGVMVTTQNLNNFVNGIKKVVEFNSDKTMLSVTTICFDIFGLEMWCTLTSGMTLVVANEEEQNMPTLLNKLCLENKVNMIQTTPSRYSVIFAEKSNLQFLDNITEILVGGEPLNNKILTKMRENSKAKIFNLYGPTETTIWSTVKEMTQKQEITVGKPIANTQCYILNKNHKILPLNVPGELYIGGDGVTNGYLKREDLNNEKFIKTQFAPNKVIYSTNDLAYYKENGEIVHLGRTDSQVKMRGYRIELGEIENIIEKNKNVNQAVVIKQTIGNNREVLIAHYTVTKPNTDIIEELKESLNKELPQYMVPQYFSEIEKMPYTPNGKIDRKALAKIELQEINKTIVKPRNELDKELINILSKMLRVENISITDTLLDLGGDSLTAITLSTKILSKYNVQVNIKELLSSYTIKDLSDYIKENKNEGTIKAKIEKAPEQEAYPLSSAQTRIYYNSKMIGDQNLVYNMPGAIMVNKILDKEKVEESINKIIERHSTLRTKFVLENNNVVQKIEPEVKLSVPVYHNSEDEVKEIINNFSKPFELEKAPLLRVELHYINNEKTLLLVDSHHIVMDGTSLNNLIIEFERLYNGENLKKIPIQYKDYAVWEEKFNKGEELKKIENYWVNKFKNSEFEQLNLPYDYKITGTRSYNGNRVTNVIDEKKFRKIERYAKKIGVSPYMFFISAFYILLYKYTGQNEIILGSPIANRDRNEMKRMIGMFVNNIVTKANINPEETFQNFLNEMREQILDDLSNQPYPFDMLVKKLGIKADNSRNPLFDVMFTYQNKEENTLKLDENETKIVELNNKIAKFNLSMEIKPKSHAINIEYSTDLFKEQTIYRLFEHYFNVIDCIMENANVLIRDIEIISKEEKNKILNEFNNTKTDYPRNKTVIQLFEEQVKKNAGQIAVECGIEKITYKELDEKSNYLANKLSKHGIEVGDVIGININRSIELIIAMIATLKLGAIYMPMYIGYPNERLEYMLQNSGAKVLIYKDEKNLKFNGIREKIDSYMTMNTSEKLENCNKFSSDETAYIIYTSGSTGKPKGVQIRHRNLINFVEAFTKYYNNDITTKDRFLASTNISFDVSIWEIFLPLLNGATLVLHEEEIIQNILTYVDSIEKNNITGLYIPPNILEDVYTLLKERENIKINKILVGVEPIRKNILNKYYNLGHDIVIINGYGPTETTICCTALKYFRDEQDGIVPIGRPLKNDNIYILSQDRNIQPIGVLGEIYVTGAGVGKGYINKDEETNKNFLPNIFDNKSEKMYKTGDIAKWNEDGTINFVGRNDSQIKISGHRIELSEINQTIMKYPSIIKAHTMTCKKGDKNYIVSYYIAEKEIAVTDIEIFLKEKLADYMIPNFILQLPEFPLTPNGKIDKEKLPTNFGIRAKFVEPRNEFEEKIAEIFKKLFLLKKVGIDDNFFDLGGDSLTAIKFQVEALNLGLKITYSDIFSNPTIRMLSEKSNNKVIYKANEGYDYSNINRIIAKNNINELKENINKHKINNVLLIGATGFLGVHILEQLILADTNKIYCIVRAKSSMEPETRLKKNLEFYFGDKYNYLFGDKIIVIDGDITDKKLGQNDESFDLLAQKVDVVIHTAAIVKHYGNFKNFNDTNVVGTMNVAEFCKKFNKKMYYISTLSVSGNMMKENDDGETIEFRENEFYIGQDLNNVYIYTKFEAEMKIFEEIQKGLDACILRIGNITNRYSDGKFQINVSENAFINRIKAILKLGVIPENFLKHKLEFTPVDCCAEAIVKIVENDPEFTVLHLFNNNFIGIDEILKTLKDIEKEVNPVSNEEFKEKIDLALKDIKTKNEINGIITDLDENKTLNLINYVIPNCDMTCSYLEKIGYKWPIIDNEYIKKYIQYFEKIKYI